MKAKARKPAVKVVYQERGRWTVHVEGHTGIWEFASIIVARYTTRDSANQYAKALRKALRGGS